LLKKDFKDFKSPQVILFQYAQYILRLNKTYHRLVENLFSPCITVLNFPALEGSFDNIIKIHAKKAMMTIFFQLCLSAFSIFRIQYLLLCFVFVLNQTFNPPITCHGNLINRRWTLKSRQATAAYVNVLFCALCGLNQNIDVG